jgi:tRNA (guanine37-N1)-methyltransferase
VKFDVITIFPQMVRAAVGEGVVGRAMAEGILDIAVHDLREYTDDRHRVVDDVPYGGGPGMVLKPEPIVRAVEGIRTRRGRPGAVIVTSPQGRLFTQREAERLANLAHVVIICGRYEGVDERVPEALDAEELSIGDYVLTGGEPAAVVIVDAVARLVPGVVGDETSLEAESFARGLLDFPQYTRPAVFRDQRVPDVLVSGHHGEIRVWRKREALRRTLERRPELLSEARLDAEEQALLEELLAERRKGVEDGRD